MQIQVDESKLTKRQNAHLLLRHYSLFFEQNPIYHMLLKEHRENQ